jgi:hypothetical protein
MQTIDYMRGIEMDYAIAIRFPDQDNYSWMVHSHKKGMLKSTKNNMRNYFLKGS